jgi:integrase
MKRANANLTREGLPPLPASLTPHGLRRTFASVLYALGEAPPVVMAEMGHTSPALALKVYAQAMRRGPEEQDLLRSLIDGEPDGFGNRIGNRDQMETIERLEGAAA